MRIPIEEAQAEASLLAAAARESAATGSVLSGRAALANAKTNAREVRRKATRDRWEKGIAKKDAKSRAKTAEAAEDTAKSKATDARTNKARAKTDRERAKTDRMRYYTSEPGPVERMFTNILHTMKPGGGYIPKPEG
jgi:uncharacterized alpha-E superfamily protein